MSSDPAIPLESEKRAKIFREIVEENRDLGSSELEEMVRVRLRSEGIEDSGELEEIAGVIDREKQEWRKSREIPGLEVLNAVKEAIVKAGGFEQFSAKVKEVDQVARLVGGLDNLKAIMESLAGFMTDC